MFAPLFLKTNTQIEWSKNLKKNPAHIINPDTGLEVKKNVFISVPYVPDLGEELRRISQYSSLQAIFKGANNLKSMHMQPKDRIPSQQNIVYKWSCPEEIFNISYIGESCRHLESSVKKTIVMSPVQFKSTAFQKTTPNPTSSTSR